MSIDVMDQAKEVVVARASDPEMVQGRREFFSYRELGVTKATDGKMRAQVTIATQGLSEETGWHVHLCDGQFVYILEGWVDLEFAGGRKERIVAGDSIFIQGDTPHNETATSNECQILEVSIPADMGTEPCDKPD